MSLSRIPPSKRKVSFTVFQVWTKRDSTIRWYTLLNYLYTGKISFLPLSSLAPGGQRGSPTSSVYGPKCSAKSMYRLACKVRIPSHTDALRSELQAKNLQVGLDHLRDQALAHVRSNLTEDNILQELSCSLVSGYVLPGPLPVVSFTYQTKGFRNYERSSSTCCTPALHHLRSWKISPLLRGVSFKRSFLMEPISSLEFIQGY